MAARFVPSVLCVMSALFPPAWEVYLPALCVCCCCWPLLHLIYINEAPFFPFFFLIAGKVRQGSMNLDATCFFLLSACLPGIWPSAHVHDTQLCAAACVMDSKADPDEISLMDVLPDLVAPLFCHSHTIPSGPTNNSPTLAPSTSWPLEIPAAIDCPVRNKASSAHLKVTPLRIEWRSGRPCWAFEAISRQSHVNHRVNHERN